MFQTLIVHLRCRLQLPLLLINQPLFIIQPLL